MRCKLKSETNRASATENRWRRSPRLVPFASGQIDFTFIRNFVYQKSIDLFIE